MSINAIKNITVTFQYGLDNPTRPHTLKLENPYLVAGNNNSIYTLTSQIHHDIPYNCKAINWIDPRMPYASYNVNKTYAIPILKKALDLSFQLPSEHSGLSIDGCNRSFAINGPANTVSANWHESSDHVFQNLTDVMFDIHALLNKNIPPLQSHELQNRLATDLQKLAPKFDKDSQNTKEQINSIFKSRINQECQIIQIRKQYYTESSAQWLTTGLIFIFSDIEIHLTWIHYYKLKVKTKIPEEYDSLFSQSATPFTIKEIFLGSDQLTYDNQTIITWPRLIFTTPTNEQPIEFYCPFIDQEKTRKPMDSKTKLIKIL